MSFKLLHGKSEKEKIFQKFWKMYDLDYSEMLGEARKIVSDIKFFSEFIERTKKSKYSFCIRFDDHTGFMRNLNERYGYFPSNLTDEDTIFRIITTERIIRKLVAEKDYDEIEQFNEFTKGWFGFDIFKDYAMFIGTAYGSEDFEKGLKEWKEKKK